MVGGCQIKRAGFIALLFGFIGDASGQGRFVFSTFDPPAGNQVSFRVNDQPATGPDLFVEVAVSTSSDPHVPFTPLEPLLALNGTGAGAGYTTPPTQIYYTGFPAGTTVFVAYRMFLGSSAETALLSSPREGFNHETGLQLSVTLTEPPSAPNEVSLGTAVVTFPVPEPHCWVLGLVGAGIVTAIGRRWRS